MGSWPWIPRPQTDHCVLPMPYSGPTRLPMFSPVYSLPCFQDPVVYSILYLTSSELASLLHGPHAGHPHFYFHVLNLSLETPSLLSMHRFCLSFPLLDRFPLQCMLTSPSPASLSLGLHDA